MQTDILGAYVSVATTVTDFVRDWLIDGWLPRIYFGSRTVSLAARAQQPASVSLRVERFLGVFVIRRCDNGDLEEIWFPELGACSETCRHTGVRIGRRFAQSKGPFPTLAPEYEAYLRSADFKVALTLIPYDGYRVEEAKRVAEQIGRPFIEVENQSVFSSGPQSFDCRVPCRPRQPACGRSLVCRGRPLPASCERSSYREAASGDEASALVRVLDPGRGLLRRHPRSPPSSDSAKAMISSSIASSAYGEDWPCSCCFGRVSFSCCTRFWPSGSARLPIDRGSGRC